MSRKRMNQIMEPIKLRGSIEYEVLDAMTGKTVRRGKGKNAVLYVGRSWGLRKLASADLNSSADPIGYLAFGSATTAAATSDTNLGGYFTYKSVAAAFTTNTTTSPYVQFTCSFNSTDLVSGEGWNSVLYEFALRNSTGEAGTIFSHYVSGGVINATNTNQLLITYTVSN